MRIPEQIKRLGLVIGVLIAVVLVTRFVLIPKRLIASEVHRATTVQRETAKAVKYAGSSACATCHDDVATKKSKGYHKNLACEGCHGAAAQHTEDISTKPVVSRDRKACSVCHAYDASRPTGFPQINVTAHNPLRACVTCHNPHDPVPSRPPEACSACHAQIERTKAVSSHALLPCTTCHTALPRHKIAPRSALPSKPETREFCARCHGKEASPTEAFAKDAPRVDATTHGGRVQCSQCHYPHLPEGRT